MTTRSISDTFAQFVRIPFEETTYRRLAYLLLAGPLGFAYFVGATTGISTGLSLSTILIGLPILGLTLLAVTGAAWLEAHLSRALLDQETPVPTALSTFQRGLDDPETDVLAACKAFLVDPTTWTSLVVVLLKSVFGLVAFVALVVAGSVVPALLAAPLLYDDPTVTYQAGSLTVTTLPVALGLAGLGVILGLVALHVLTALADLGGYLTDALLSVEQADLTE
ncbi:sensor domain-containing protein [Haloarcula montana]|uniref:sensor domain-containing protein n=1 Tax=Haloarcula montana TaxID=3111776 RepID=UPI002D777EAF|nr:sensor domain-containing protein [Haloarcula sp. GH36]